MTTLLPSRPPISKPVRDLSVEPGSYLTIPGVTWEEFESIVEEMDARRTARIAYSQRPVESFRSCRSGRGESRRSIGIGRLGV